MNKYKQEMINDRELIYDAKKQLHKADKKYKSGINMAGTSMGSYDKPMMKGGYDKPMMKGSGLEMKSGCQISKHMKGNSGINMSADLKYMPVMDREKDAMKKGDM